MNTKATKKRKSDVEYLMQRSVSDYLDECGEVNATGLAEMAAAWFYIYEDSTEFKIPVWVFDLAAEVALEFEG